MLPPFLVEEKHSKHPLKWLHIWGWLKSGGVSWGMRTRGAGAGLIGGAPDLWGRVPAGVTQLSSGEAFSDSHLSCVCMLTYSELQTLQQLLEMSLQASFVFPGSQVRASKGWLRFRHQIEHGGVGWGCQWWVSMWSLSPCSLWGHPGFIGSSDLLLCPVWDKNPVLDSETLKPPHNQPELGPASCCPLWFLAPS